MASINFLEESYNYRTIEKEVNKVINKQFLDDEISKLVKEVNNKFKDLIATIKDRDDKLVVMEEKIIEVIDLNGIVFEDMTRDDLIKIIIDEIFGYSIIQKYIEDETINDIMVNGYDNIWIRKGMTDIRVPEKFKSERAYEDFVKKIAAFIGKQVNPSSPQAEGTDDKYNLRISISQAPVNTYSTSLIIRKNHKNLDLTRIISEENYPEDVLLTLRLLRDSGVRVIFAGPLESGKTTIMNAWLNMVKNQRIVVMEDSPELLISNPNTIYLRTVQDKNNEVVKVNLADLVKSFKRTNGTMPVVSEVRSIEAVELLDIFNAGFLNGCTSLHANSAKEVVRQLVFQIKASNKLGTDRKELEEYISRTIDLIIYMEKRKIVSISEVSYDEENEKIEIRDIHKYYIEEETRNEIKGYYQTYVNPLSEKLLDRIRRAGLMNEVPNKLKYGNK